MTSVTINWGVQAEMKLAALRVTYATASSVNALAPIAEELRSGNRTELGTASRLIDRLSATGDLGKALAAGTFEWARWAAIANTAGEACNNVMRRCGEDNVIGRFWSEILVPTGTDVTDIIKDNATGFGIGAGAVVALLLALWVLRR